MVRRSRATVRRFGYLAAMLCIALHSVAVPGSAAPCDPLPPPSGATTTVTPAQAGQLQSILGNAAANQTFLLEDGVYPVPSFLVIRAPGVTLRSKNGNRDAVVLDAAYSGGARELLNITASNVTVADLTVMRALDHTIHVQSPNGNVTGTRIYNVKVLDSAQQAIKINPSGGGFTDDGLIACSHIELTDAGRPHVRDNCYTGGIDAHQSRGWVIRDNYVTGWWCAAGLAEHGIHLWTGSRDTVIERNFVVNNARGIGLGLGFQTNGRSYSDQPCAGRANVGHYGGVIRNNFVFANSTALFSSGSGVDVGIGLEDTCAAEIKHNTVFTTQAPFSSIEYRFSRNDGKSVPPTVVANNVVSHVIRARDGATAEASGNLQNAPASLFVNPAVGDLHLLPSATAAIDKGLPAGVTDDFDGQGRDTAPDLGADERTDAPPPPNPPDDPPSNPPGEDPPTTPPAPPGDPNPPAPPPALILAVAPDVATLPVRTSVSRGRVTQSVSGTFYVAVASTVLSPRAKVTLLAAVAGAPPGTKVKVRLKKRSLRPNQLTSLTFTVSGPSLPAPSSLLLGVVAISGGAMDAKLVPIQVTP